MLTIGLLLRIVTMVGYRWAMWFNDGFEYVDTALHMSPHPVRPDGYAFMLWLLSPFHSFALITALQHLMGLGIGMMIYTLLRGRFGLPAWGATLAAAPVLLDGYQIQLEHMVMSDVPFLFLTMVVVTIILSKQEMTASRGAVVGLLVGSAVLVRSIGLSVLIVTLAYLLIRRVGWRALGATTAGAAVLLVGYAFWFHSVHGRYALSNSDGPFLYARVMKFADCNKIHPPVDEIPLCTAVPRDRRLSSQSYVWDYRASPLHRPVGQTFSNSKNDLTGRFARRAIAAQPGDYLQVVGYDVFRVFKWKRTVFPDKMTYDRYEFQRKEPRPVPSIMTVLLEYGHSPATRVVEPFGGVMRFYQRHFYVRGTMFGVILLGGLLGMMTRWRRLGGRALLPWGIAAAMIVTPACTAEFDYRYVLPAVPMACVAAAIALRGMGRWRVVQRFKKDDHGEAPKERSSRDPDVETPELTLN
ncbi:hypothetical protein NE236_17525 [Actinoallomurus purpureus]|uniref:hypothetical protein n=1 Tax=Actinoallomurus purpureus TaxID=478114 RepID=UPI002093765C|nr:hypothetical protein [Actinoallomurus purpureus]MCO6006789.1 hypothetical protein [Actinoallomurus purpureus]